MYGRNSAIKVLSQKELLDVSVNAKKQVLDLSNNACIAFKQYKEKSSKQKTRKAEEEKSEIISEPT